MIDALYSSVSGLNGFQTALNTESNNIANVSTVAYKSDNISFSDQMYQNGIGKGINTEVIDKSYSQGNLKITNEPYDMAISGKGFFMVQGDTQEVQYTRAGNFHMAEDGTLRAANDYKVLGLSAQTSSVVSSSDDTMFTDEYTNFLGSQVVANSDNSYVETINSKSTDYHKTAVTDPDTQKGDNYKTRTAKIADVDYLSTAYRNELSLYSSSPIAGVAPTNQTSTISFDKTQITNEYDSVELTIDSKTYTAAFDTDAQTTLNNLADQISNTKGLSASADDNGNISVKTLLPGEDSTISDAKLYNGSVSTTPKPTIDTTAAVKGSGKAQLDAVESALKGSIENADGKFLQISSVIDSRDLKADSTGTLQLKLDALNISDSPFGTTELDNGILYINQGDNRYAVGKITTAVFSNDSGLDPRGDNLYSATTDSGDMIFATNENKILDNTLELSNSDLSESLVNLMVYQRAYEANSKSVTTSDEFLKTALAMKK